MKSNEMLYPMNHTATVLLAREESETEKAERLQKEEAERKRKEEEGKSKPSDKEAALLKEVMQKKEKLQAAEAQLAEVQTKLKQFEGIDPVKVKELLAREAQLEEERKKAEQKKLEAEGNWDALKKQMNEAHRAQMEQLEKQANEKVTVLSTENTSLKGMVAELTVGNAFGNSKFITEEMALPANMTRQVFGSHFEYKDGKVVAYDKPAGAANRTMLIDGQGEPLPFEAAIKKIVESDVNADRLLKSKLKTGANSGGTNKNGDPERGRQPDLKGRDRIAMGLKQKAA